MPRLRLRLRRAWRSSPRTPTPPASASRRCWRCASRWPPLLFWVDRRACAARRCPPPPRRCSPAPRPRRDRLRRAGRALLRRAHAHRRVADVAAALHLPGARLPRRAARCGREQPTAAASARSALASAGTALVLLGGCVGRVDGRRRRAWRSAAAVAYATYILVADRVVGDVDPFAARARWSPPARPCRCSPPGLRHRRARRSASPPPAGLDRRARRSARRSSPISAFLARPARVGPATASIVSTARAGVTVGAGDAALRRGARPVADRRRRRSCSAPSWSCSSRATDSVAAMALPLAPPLLPQLARSRTSAA